MNDLATFKKSLTFRKRLFKTSVSGLAISIVMAFGGVSVSHADCQNTGSFNNWLSEFKQEAINSGISKNVVASALNNVQFDPSIIRKDRAQGVFAQPFLKFAGRMVSEDRMRQGRKNLNKYSQTLANIGAQYGVPGEVLASFWGLETDFGVNNGKSATIPALATLAYDCRRPALFRPQLLGALKILERGDLSLGEMRGAWAGELGQMQFLPFEYNEFGVDFDGDGRRNLIKSAPDVLASAANLMRSFGWRAGEPWLKEVRVPNSMDWSQARLDNKLSHSQWASMGVSNADGSTLSDSGIPASLILPMGKNGPAFLAYPNFNAYLEWNQSLVYSLTAAYYSTRLAGAPRVSSGNGSVQPLSVEEVKALQKKLADRGFQVGKIDGIIGQKTRSAVRDVQQQLGLPADGYPKPNLINQFQ
jgi:lytic murein transglycosylase